MRYLPALVAASGRWVLPMGDRSAQRLAELLAAGNEPGMAEILRSQLAVDPPLLVWVICLADRDDFRPRSLREAAAWLAEHARDALQWEADEVASFDAPAVEAAAHAERVAAAVGVSKLAGHLAEQDRPALADEARLMGLMHGRQFWGAKGDRAAANAHLPKWLADDGSLAATYRVQAERLLQSDESQPAVGEAAARCRDEAESARRAWLESLPGAGARLPLLAARLRRLAGLESEFQRTLEQEKLEALAEFAAGAGHEINNPVAVIAGRVQLLLREERDPERRRALALVNAQANRIYEMIADVRLFARPPAPTMNTINLATLVDEVIRELAPLAAEQSTTIGRAGPEGPVVVQADPVQLAVALQAMCKNSLEAMGRDGRIEIGLEAEGRHVRIHVSDTGPGIPPDVRRHLFDPFYSARQAGRGLGLGLSKCWRIVVTNHGGRIDVASREGGGAVFTITLPRRQSPCP